MTETKEKTENKIPILPHDWNSQLAKACNVTKTTVTQAVRYNTRGKKADMVRAKYREMFVENNSNK